MIKYVPILRGKDGEYAALSNLDQDVADVICPLIQFLPDTNTKRKGNYLEKIITKVTKAWDFDENQLYFDVIYIDDIAFVEKLAKELSKNNINIIPVIHTNSKDEYLDIVKRSYNKNGICLRFTKTTAKTKIINETITRIINLLEIKKDEIDILIDFGYINSSDDAEIFKDHFVGLYNTIENTENYRRLIVSAGSFPKDVTGIKANTIKALPRIEWDLWKKINEDINDDKLIYSDYGNVHPIIDLEEKAHEGSCTIKYSSENQFYIFRGELASKHSQGGKQYHDKSQLVITHSCYDGRNFSWGDGLINDCANRAITSGNPGTWVKITLNHHYTKIVDLLG